MKEKKVFGKALQENEGVPPLMQKLIDFLDEKGNFLLWLVIT